MLIMGILRRRIPATLVISAWKMMHFEGILFFNIAITVGGRSTKVCGWYRAWMVRTIKPLTLILINVSRSLSIIYISIWMVLIDWIVLSILLLLLLLQLLLLLMHHTLIVILLQMLMLLLLLLVIILCMNISVDAMIHLGLSKDIMVVVAVGLQLMLLGIVWHLIVLVLGTWLLIL